MTYQIKPPSVRAPAAVPMPSQTRMRASTVATHHSGLRAPQIVDWRIGCAAWALRSERSRRLIRRSLALLHCRNVRSARISRVMRLLSIITLRSTFRDLDRLDAWMISEKHDDVATRVPSGAPSRVHCPELEVDVTRSFGATSKMITSLVTHDDTI